MLVAGVVLAAAAVGVGVVRSRSSQGGNPDLGLVAAYDLRSGADRRLQSPTASSTTVMAVNSNTGAVAFLDGRSGRPGVTSRAPFTPTAWLLTPTVAVLVTQSDSSVPGWKQRLTAIEIASGRRLWQRTLGRFYELGGPPGDDRVVLLSWPTSNTTSTQQAFDVRSGRRLWRRAGPEPFTIEGEASGAGLALFHHATGISALDLRTGRERWHVAGQGEIVVGQGSVAVIGDTVRMLAARTGAVRWTRPLPATHARFGASAAIAAGVLVVAASSPSFKPYTE